MFLFTPIWQQHSINYYWRMIIYCSKNNKIGCSITLVDVVEYIISYEEQYAVRHCALLCGDVQHYVALYGTSVAMCGTVTHCNALYGTSAIGSSV